MTDAAERKVRQWALKRNGESLENRDIVELVFAFDEDNEARHDEVVEQIQTLAAEGNVRRERIEALERWRVRQEENCEARMLAIAKDEHEARHNAHMIEYHPPRRESDPAGADYTKERGGAPDEIAARTFFMWTLGGKLGAALIAVIVAVVVTLINIALNYLWFGHP